MNEIIARYKTITRYGCQYLLMLFADNLVSDSAIIIGVSLTVSSIYIIYYFSVSYENCSLKHSLQINLFSRLCGHLFYLRFD